MFDQLYLPHLPVHRDLVQRLRHWSGERPDRIAFYYLVDGEDEETRITYGQLDRRARAIAAEFQARGLAGQRALLLFPPGLEFVAALFGCFYAGVVAVPAYPPRRNRNMQRIQAIADDAGAKAALSVFDVTQRVDCFLDEAPNLRDLQWLATDQVSDELAPRWAPPELERDSLAVLQYTSGSTGIPKGVMLTHGNVMHNCGLITCAFQTGDYELGLSWLPTYHDMGLIGGVLNSLYCGRPTVLMSPMSFLQQPYRWLRAISKYRVAVSGGPNFAYDICTKKVTPEQVETLDLRSWELAFNGAEPVRASTLDKFCRKFEPCGFRPESFYPCYGMAESTLIVTGGARKLRPLVRTFDGKRLDDRKVVEVAPTHHHARDLIGCGGALPEGQVVIVDPQRHVRLPQDRVGEIWVASDSVGKGYLNKRRETRHTFQAKLAGDGARTYLRTGDLGFFKYNELFVTGRLKDLIIIRGVNHYPQDIEMTVEAADERLRNGSCAAFAVDIEGRERLIIVSEVERIRKDDWSDVISAIRRDVTTVHDVAPDGIVLVRAGSIPKTSSSKIQRHACRNGFLDGSLLAVAHYYGWQHPERDGKPPRGAAVGAVAGRTLIGGGNGASLLPQDSPHADTLAPHGKITAKEHSKR
jgi:acyl-CoA synthetase (AMP-forming)/AMP-acid ligase II